MDPIKPTLEELNFCMKDPKCIRNVCILAHVDHGKTTIADLLLATNRLVSKRLAGFLRYLDDRPDEQERGITMKSSAVSLLNIVHDESDGKNKKIMLNLIDTPGHIDFSSEVGAALRVSDGAIVLVDLVEGVCVQTRESIKKAFEEHTKMLLILNKFDRLIVELQKDIHEIFQCILRVIEDCNAIIAELYQYEFTNNDNNIEDTGLLFSPDAGNIIFASAIDGWGITTRQIASMFADLLNNETVDSLDKKLWNFDCYVDSKKEVQLGAIDKKKTNLFVQFFIKTIVQIYETIVLRMERNKTNFILEKLKITTATRDMTHTDPKVQIRAIMQTWKPLATTIFLQCLKIIPSPCKMDKTKIEYLLNTNIFCDDPYLNSCVKKMIPSFEDITAESNISISYLSKMFCIEKKNLSQNKPKVFVPKPRDPEVVKHIQATNLNNKKSEYKVEVTEKEDSLDTCIRNVNNEIAVIALARVFSGKLRVGQEMYVLTGNYLPDKEKIAANPEHFIDNNKNVKKILISELYVLLGRELMLVDSIPAGNFCGIGGLDTDVLRTATLSSSLSVIPLTEKQISEPVVRYAVEPVDPKQLPILRHGLKLLMQSDSCVQVIMQETGELVLMTAGDVHLAKCIEDLKTKFAKIEIQVSRPMVSLRETVMTRNKNNSVTLETSVCVITVLVVSLENSLKELIRNNFELLKTLEYIQSKSFIDIVRQLSDDNLGEKISKEKVFKNKITTKAIAHVRDQLRACCDLLGPCWKGFETKIWSVGDMKESINLLINDTNDYKQNIFTKLNKSNDTALFDHCIIKAFNAFCKAGPLCEEHLADCTFIVSRFELKKEVVTRDITLQTTSTIVSNIRTAFKKAFEAQEQRLMEPIYITDIQVNTSILGKVYTVVSKRHGKVLDAVGMDEQEKTFLVKAQIPVIQSEGFANEIRISTSGQANPNLRFSHYEIIDGDPFYEAVEEEDDEDDNVKVDLALRANKLRKEVRRRKGLHVEDEVVINAEKQRTLNKKK